MWAASSTSAVNQSWSGELSSTEFVGRTLHAHHQIIRIRAVELSKSSGLIVQAPCRIISDESDNQVAKLQTQGVLRTSFPFSPSKNDPNRPPDYPGGATWCAPGGHTSTLPLSTMSRSTTSAFLGILACLLCAHEAVVAQESADFFFCTRRCDECSECCDALDGAGGVAVGVCLSLCGLYCGPPDSSSRTKDV